MHTEPSSTPSQTNKWLLAPRPIPTPTTHSPTVQDESVRYKSQLRAINLYEKSNTITHNPLTGEVRNPLPRPSPPVAPAPYVTVAPWDK